MADPNVERIFHESLAKEEGPERAAFLDDACGGDAGLRERVDALLRAHADAGSFLESPAAPVREGAGSRIGPYKLLQRIGEGGMGVVYMAEQVETVRRKVALKIIKLGMDTKQVIARFEAERQALALMDHDNIARVLDAGATETGRPYFVMELVKGIPIAEYCDVNNLTPRARLELFLPICAAVQHAHQKGIIHRDLKPSNVLVTLHDGNPVPKVIDFGIAKATNQRLTEKTLFTEFRTLIGTPEYMSPEQAEMSGLDIDTRTDIYSLGVLLYELLSGTTPFSAKTLREAGYAEFQRIVREEEPQPLSTRISTMGEQLAEIAKHRRVEPAALSRIFRGDLDWIVLKALEKDRTRRYASATELAGDIVRHLSDQPVVAGPPSASYWMRKFVRRNRRMVFAASLVAAALVVGTAVALFGLVQAREEAARSQTIADFLQDMLISTDPSEAMTHEIDVSDVVATARDVFGGDHATVAATLSSRAAQLQGMGNYDAAEPLHRESIRLWTAVHGADHPMVGVALGRLGTLLRIKGDDDGAEKALRESLRIAKDHGLYETVITANTLLELAEVLQNQGHYEKTLPLLRESLRIRRAVAAYQRFHIALTLNSILRNRAAAGEKDVAASLMKETIVAWREALPPKSRGLAKVLSEYGRFLLGQGELDDAEAMLRESIDIYLGGVELSNLYRDMALGGIASIVAIRDDGTPEYESARYEFLAYARRVLDEESWMLGQFLAAAAAHNVSARPVRAIEEATEAATILHKSGKDARSLQQSLRVLAKSTWAVAQEPVRPEAEFRTALRGIETYRSLAPDDFAAVRTLAVLQHRLGKDPSGALALLEDQPCLLEEARQHIQER